MALQTSASINGAGYGMGSSFRARISFTGKAASDGSGGSSAVTAGTTYTFLYYNPGSRYPYAIGLPGYGATVRCWVQASVFPYATYTVAYNANGGSGAPRNQTKTYGSSLRLSEAIPTRNGHVFKGWATSSNGGVAYSPGSNYNGNAGITLYAVWSPYQHTVAYNANGGSGAPGSQIKTYGSAITLSSVKPIRPGYTFVNWNTKQDGTGSGYDSGGTYEYDQNSGTVVLYAQWILNKYEISYDANGGTGNIESQMKTYGVDLVLASVVPTREGYTFKGWNTDRTATVAMYAAGDTYTANAGAVLYAVWVLNEYKITFNASKNGGTGDRVITVKHGENISPMPVATRQYYVFVGWFTSPDGGEEVTESKVFTADAILYAHYVIDASVHVRDSGKEKPGFPYVWHNGQLKKGYSYVWHDGAWRQGTT